MTEDILLADLGSIFWTAWFSGRSQFEAYERTISILDWRAQDYQAIIVCADSPRNWRHDLTANLEKEKQYKANRPKKAPEAIASLESLIEHLPTIGYPVALVDNFEADDLIATMCKQSTRSVDILSEDKDLYQLITDSTRVLTRSGVMTREECKRKFGVYPERMRDMLALVGDSADNVDGCPKVGPAKAAILLERFGDLDGIAKADVDELIELPGIGKTLAANIQWWDGKLARDLVSLRFDCPVNIDELAALYSAPEHFTSAIDERISV